MQLPYNPVVILLDIYPRYMRMYIHIKTYTPMFIAVLFIEVPHWRQLRCPSAQERLNTLWYSHTMEYYWVIKKNKLLIHAATWMNPRELCWVKKQIPGVIYCLIPFIQYSWNDLIIDTKNRLVVARSLGQSGRGVNLVWL